MSLGPYDLTGGPFLTLYLALLAMTVVAGIVIPHRLRPAGRRHRVTDVDQLAYLAGGPGRFADALVSRLLAARSLVMVGNDRFRATADADAASPAEWSVLQLRWPIRWKEIELTLGDYVQPLQDRMVAAGLLVSDDERAMLRFRATLPYALLIMFGAVKLIVGELRDRPIGILTALLVVTAIVAVIRWFSVDRRTQAGREAVDAARSEAARLMTAPTTPEVSLAVALYGTAVLAGSGWSDFHHLRTARGDSGGSGGCGGDGGGGGCGGGGCGGCGGGG